MSCLMLSSGHMPRLDAAEARSGHFAGGLVDR